MMNLNLLPILYKLILFSEFNLNYITTKDSQNCNVLYILH